MALLGFILDIERGKDYYKLLSDDVVNDLCLVRIEPLADQVVGDEIVIEIPASNTGTVEVRDMDEGDAATTFDKNINVDRSYEFKVTPGSMVLMDKSTKLGKFMYTGSTWTQVGATVYIRRS